MLLQCHVDIHCDHGNIIVISFLTSSLLDNLFTEEGKKKLRKAKEERDSSFVKFENFVV